MTFGSTRSQRAAECYALCSTRRLTESCLKSGNLPRCSRGKENKMRTQSIYLAIIIVFFCSFADAQWVPTSFPDSISANCLVVSGSNLFVGTIRGVFLSANNGTTWNFAGLDSVGVTSFAVSATNLFAGTPGSGILLSTNNGTSWAAVNEGLPKGGGMWVDSAHYISITCLAWSGQNLFAGMGSALTGGGVFRSTNNGTNWTRVGKSWPSTVSLVTDTLGTSSGEHLFVGGWGGGVYQHTENDSDWVECGRMSNIVSLQAGALALLPDGVDSIKIYAGTTFHWVWGGQVDGEGAFLSTDNGGSWSGVNNGLTNLNIHSFVTNVRSLFAGTDAGVFITTNGGISWNAVNAGLKDTVLALALSGKDLFAGTRSAGVWRRPLSELITSVEPTTSELPNSYLLQQNYPNPFNPSTKITFSLPKSSDVKLSVYDVLGRQVSMLVNERRDAGVHEVNFDALGLASGVYFYRLQAGDFVQTRKLALVR
jgi:hypothetical protein